LPREARLDGLFEDSQRLCDMVREVDMKEKHVTSYEVDKNIQPDGTGREIRSLLWRGQ
jgi:hypothetical protein